MKKYRIIARQGIIDPKTNRVHDNFGLMTLNGQQEDVVEMDAPIDKTCSPCNLSQTIPDIEDRTSKSLKSSK